MGFPGSLRHGPNYVRFLVLDEAPRIKISRYVLGGNAMGMTAAEGFKRRKLGAFDQPDSVVVSIGYALTDSVYDVPNRYIDYKLPFETFRGPAGGSEAFLYFVDDALRP